MDEFEFREEDVAVVRTVGNLRELLKDYDDNMPLYVCGLPGLFHHRVSKQCITLETQDSDGYQYIEEHMMADICYMDEAEGEAYMDF